MNQINSTEEWLGFLFILTFISLMIVYSKIKSSGTAMLRDIPAFKRFKRSIALAVEAGTRIHISIGHGNLNSQQCASAFMGLSLLQRIGRIASVSDCAPIATSGDATLAILSQDTLQDILHGSGNDIQFDSGSGQLIGLTPFSFAAGVIPILNDQQVSANLLAGSFGSEVALITDAAERKGIITLAGSENITAQAVMYASAQEPLIGEELFAAGAYFQSGIMHIASIRTQDIFRIAILFVIVIGVISKLLGVI